MVIHEVAERHLSQRDAPGVVRVLELVGIEIADAQQRQPYEPRGQRNDASRPGDGIRPAKTHAVFVTGSIRGRVNVLSKHPRRASRVLLTPRYSYRVVLCTGQPLCRVGIVWAWRSRFRGTRSPSWTTSSRTGIGTSCSMSSSWRRGRRDHQLRVSLLAWLSPWALSS